MGRKYLQFYDEKFCLSKPMTLFTVCMFSLSVNTEEVDLWKVNVKLVIPGFAVEKKLFKSATPKPGVSECDVKFDTE